MKSKVLNYQTKISRPLPEVFDFFSKAENLNRLTPESIHFKILTPLPILMKVGQRIDYRIKLFGIPFLWQTEICEWQPNVKFADKQLSGPYVEWHHQHIFEEENGQTLMTDIITYKSKGWILAPFLHWFFVDRNVKEIFAHRETKLNEIFPTTKFN
ncbi:MAG: CDP-paratose 2-epimerase [Bacteroidetes bacterium B1(2017)]|nr:MAG: CDP-paratose 2-epimerase [Bacteroidetes bacterium B1(2017)]